MHWFLNECNALRGKKINGSLPLDVTLYIFFIYLFFKSPQRCVHLITHWEGGNLCIVIKYSSERMAEAGLCGWLPGDDGGKSLEVQEDRRRRRRKKNGVCCVNHISRSDVLMPKLLRVCFFFHQEFCTALKDVAPKYLMKGFFLWAF